jgi:hypothetical protein
MLNLKVIFNACIIVDEYTSEQKGVQRQNWSGIISLFSSYSQQLTLHFITKFTCNIEFEVSNKSMLQFLSNNYNVLD